MLWACAGCLAFVGGIWGWRRFSALKANIERSTGVLKPLQALGEVLDNGDEPDVGDVARLAERPELRHPLYRLLSVYRKAELMPAEFLGPEAQAEAALALVLIDKYGREGGMIALRFVRWVHAMADDEAMCFGVFEFIDPLQEDLPHVAVVGRIAEEGAPYSTVLPVLVHGSGLDADDYIAHHLKGLRQRDRWNSSR